MNSMSAQQFIGILLLVGGLLGVAYGGFSYTKEEHTANIGSLHMAVDEKKHVNIPLWGSIAAVVIGGVLLLIPRKI